MNLFNRNRHAGLTSAALRLWGMLFVVAGAISHGVLQNRLLGLNGASAEEVLNLMQTNSTYMTMASVALILQAAETCAVPIFALLLAEGMQHTKDFKAYFVRILKLALITEIPYNLAMGGSLLHMETRNPVFGLLLSMIMISFFKRYPAGRKINSLIKVLIVAAAIVWCAMLSIEFGAATVLITAILWWMRGNTLYRNFAGATGAIVCTMFSPFFLASPMGFMVVHFYGGEKGTTSRMVNYLAYPVMLILGAVLGMVL
jgi:hypothetical protein